MKNEKCVEVCNNILREELSAIETYKQAIAKFGIEPIGIKLETIKADHEKSALRLSKNIESMGGTPSSDSGAWGTFTKAVESSASLLGENATLTALRTGEEYGKSLYEDALENNDVMDNCKTIMREELLPMQVQHISEIAVLISNN